MSGHVFVSYAREDADFVLPLAQALLRRSVDLWVDQLRINPADNWDKSIDDALYDCGKLLPFLSPAAVAWWKFPPLSVPSGELGATGYTSVKPGRLRCNSTRSGS